MTYTIHLKPELETLRVFKESDSYEDRSTPILSATVHYISDEEIYLCNLVGELSRIMLRSVMVEFYKKGYKKLKCERKGKMLEYDLHKVSRV